MTQRSIHNNTNIPLKPFSSFTGQWEPTSTFLEISAYLNSSAYLAVSIQQSQDANAVVINTTYNYTPTDEVTVFNTGIGLPFYRIILSNEADVQIAHMALTTILTAVPSNVSATIVGDVTATISGVVDVNATNLITETLATRRVDYLVVGNWYRVATVGITTGAEWNAIGAIVNGESSPSIGRLFKCLSVGPAIAGGGTCYDVEYTTDMSATVSGTVSLTDPTTVRVRDSFGDPITTTAGNVMVGIGNIYTAHPLHTIVDSGTVGLSTSANTIKIDQANNGVKVNPTAQPPARITGLGDTAIAVGGPGLLYGISYQNKSSAVNCWVKLYDKATAPTASDTPFLIQYLESVQQYNLSHNNSDCYNAPIANTLWVRASLLPADNDSTDTGIDAEITAFVGS